MESKDESHDDQWNSLYIPVYTRYDRLNDYDSYVDCVTVWLCETDIVFRMLGKNGSRQFCFEGNKEKLHMHMRTLWLIFWEIWFMKIDWNGEKRIIL